MSIGWLLTLIFGFSGLVFIVLFGRLPRYRETFVGKLHTLLCVTIPKLLVRADNALTGGRFLWVLRVSINYLINEPNWFITVFYATILCYCLWIFYKFSWKHITSTFERFIVIFLTVAPFMSTYVACVSNPGYLNIKNVDKAINVFPYDNILYIAGHECRTCHILKPARSKHCRLCKRCIAKLDHHCVWINNCVGYSNYRYFLLFLATHFVVLCYGVWSLNRILSRQVDKFIQDNPDLPVKWLRHNIWWTVIQSTSEENKNLGSLMIIATLIMLIIIGLLIQHIVFIYQGVTTNETLKWEGIKYEVQLGRLTIYDNSLLDKVGIQPDGRGSIIIQDLGDGNSPSNGNSNEEIDGSMHLTHLSENGHRQPSDEHQRFRYNRMLTEDEMRLIEELQLHPRKLNKLTDIDNIYDKGFWQNFLEVLFPVPLDS